jgi:HPt (histidine-containing phosphotransfer) domain-containing protein
VAEAAVGAGDSPEFRWFRVKVDAKAKAMAMGSRNMMELRASGHGPAGGPSPVSGERPIDLVHLARMTLGDRSLEREVLQLFVRQAAMLLGRMEGADAETVTALAHTLRGSAQGLGAWRVATAAEAVERGCDVDAVAKARASLRAAVEEAQSVIAELLRAH